MTRSELVHHLRTLSSGTIALATCQTCYPIIERMQSSAVIYASEHASDEEISMVHDFADIIRFFCEHNRNW